MPVIPRPPFARIALLLQGGGALGAYQAGVFQALSEAGLEPGWIAGISIGGINAALIAGNPPERRVAALRTFWETVTDAPYDWPELTGVQVKGDLANSLLDQFSALGTVFQGAPGFFTPRVPPPFLRPPGAAGATSYYTAAPLRESLERLVDFDRLNTGGMRLSVGAVNVRSGNFAYFDTAHMRIGVEHVMASGALPPAFAPVEIDGDFYWDGGLVSNTPLQWLLDSAPHVDTLAFQVDLWTARGHLPRDLPDVENRIKEIRYSSRTRLAIDLARREHVLRQAAANLRRIAPEAFQNDPDLRPLADLPDNVLKVVTLIYQSRRYEGVVKDYDFSRPSMEQHWGAGYEDATRTLSDPRALQRPSQPGGIAVFDIHHEQASSR